jgi:inner membrane protein
VDPLTHCLTGLALSRAGFNRLTPHASVLMFLAAEAPELDIISAFSGSASYLHWHRHFTHSIVFLPVMAILPVLFVRYVLRRRISWRPAYLVSLVAVSTHPLLDLLNIYGVRIGLPFTHHWYRLDITNVLDIWIWGALLLAAFGPFLNRLVSQEIGARPSHGRGWAVFALAFLLIYNGGRAVLHGRAVAVLDSRLYGGEAPVRVAVIPSAYNPFQWGGIVETAEAYWIHETNLLRRFDPDDGSRFFKPVMAEPIARAGNAPGVREFVDFAQFPLWKMEPAADPEDGFRVTVTDMRFSRRPFSRFVAFAVLDSRLNVVRSRFLFDAE